MPNYNSQNEFQLLVWNGWKLKKTLLKKKHYIRDSAMKQRLMENSCTSRAAEPWTNWYDFCFLDGCIYSPLQTMTQDNKNRRTVDISIYLTKEDVSQKASLGRLVMVNNFNFCCLIRGYFCTNGAEALVFVSMLSRRNIRSWTGAWLFPSLSGWERWQTRTDYSDI